MHPDLPTLYSRVVAVNPKAAVPGLEWCPETHLADDETISARWRLNGNTVSSKIVEPIVGWHWLGLLPEGARLERSLHTGRWLVEWNHEACLTDSYATPIEALAECLTSAAYLAPGTTKEGK